MSPAEIIERVTEEGLLLALSASGSISAKGDQSAIDRWLPTIKQSKCAIIAELPGAEDAKAARAIAVRHLAEVRARGNAALAAAFAARPREARPLVTAQAHLTDGLVTTVKIDGSG